MSALESKQSYASVFEGPFWSIGFRPFFLLGTLWGLFALAIWIIVLTGGISVPGIHTFWHAHEMLHGFATAIIAGFLLTATQNWTGIRGVHGARLCALVTMWSMGRLAMLLVSTWPMVTGILDLLFLPTFIWMMRIYFSGQNRRNIPLLIAIGSLWVGNLLYHLNMNGLTEISLRTSLYFTTYIVIFMIVVIGGRVIPFFSSRIFPDTVPAKAPLLDHLATLTAIAFAFTPFIESSLVSMLIAGSAGLVNSCRLARWYDRRIWRYPILSILYIGFAWAIVGFFAAGITFFGSLSESMALHVFTAGSISTMILGMIARVSLGHTGRTIQASRAMQVAFACIVISGILRTIVIESSPSASVALMAVSATFWIAAFGLFVVTYFTILVGPSPQSSQA